MRARTRNARPKTVTVGPRSRNSDPKSRAKKEGISVEFLYLTENAKGLEAYSGHWLLIDGYQLAAHSTDFKEIKVAIARRGITSPFIYYVPTQEEANFISI